jgi:HSP20 family protein
MSKHDNEEQKNTEVKPIKTSGGLMPFDEFDSFFDDFISRKWPRLFDWNFPTEMERSFPKVDILDHDNEIEVQACKKACKTFQGPGEKSVEKFPP